jgi:hypothetical protein
MNAHEKTFGSPSGEPSTTRPYASIECAKKSGHYLLEDSRDIIVKISQPYLQFSIAD